MIKEGFLNKRRLSYDKKGFLTIRKGFLDKRRLSYDKKKAFFRTVFYCRKNISASICGQRKKFEKFRRKIEKKLKKLWNPEEKFYC